MPTVVLAFGFRPFFLLCGVYAVVAPAAWLLALHGWSWPGAPADLLRWHTHEMLVGFVGAAMSGFLLTAVPSFTGQSAVRGAPLAWLGAAWLAARAAGAFSGAAAWLPPLADLAFAGALVGLVARDIIAAGSRRNFVLVAVVASWAAAAVAHGLGLARADALLVHLVLLLVTVMAGRITPSFTANWMRSRQLEPLPAVSLALDLAAIACVVLVAVLDLAGVHGPVAALAFALAALVHAVRLLRWRGLATLPEPLLWSLHLAYAWLPVGYAIMGLAVLDVGGLSRGAALHALTIGGIGSMILAVMSRVILGHTGRPLTAQPAMALAYLLVSVAALARLAAAAFGPRWYPALLGASGCAWILAYALFLGRYAPMLLAPRADGRPG